MIRVRSRTMHVCPWCYFGFRTTNSRGLKTLKDGHAMRCEKRPTGASWKGYQ